MNLSKSFSVLIAAFLLSSCAQTAWVHKDFDSIKPNIDTVTILFPEIEFSEIDGDVKEIKPAYSVFVSNNVADVLKEIIDEGIFAPKYATILCDSFVVGRWIQNRYSNTRSQYNLLRESIRSSHNDKKTMRLTPEFRSIMDNVHTEYFILVTGLAFGTSENTKREDMMQAETFELLYDHAFSYNYQWNGLQLQIALINVKTMEILWYNRNSERDSKYNPAKKEEVKDLCVKLLNPK